MPAHTPSPHRFLAPNPPSTQKSKKPHSNLRNALDIQTPQLAKTPAQKPELQFRKLTPAKRFPPRKLERIESIEGSQELEPDNNDNDDDNDNDEMLFDTATRNKRRRTSPPSSPSLQDPSDPQTPAPTTHRFKVPPPRTPAPFPSIATVAAPTPLPTCASTPSSHRPHFILPVLPTSPPKPATPPPDIFSPSRKAAKYTPAGMASTVTSWILETANTAFAAQDRGAAVCCVDETGNMASRSK
ncbi:hypothetical protein HRS9139_04840 [Pyrenophora teres f. teres]|nr:hypothetical protein HRS9139_04840 [Pyrenophora teres f. teres]